MSWLLKFKEKAKQPRSAPTARPFPQNMSPRDAGRLALRGMAIIASTVRPENR